MQVLQILPQLHKLDNDDVTAQPAVTLAAAGSTSADTSAAQPVQALTTEVSPLRRRVTHWQSCTARASACSGRQHAADSSFCMPGQPALSTLMLWVQHPSPVMAWTVSRIIYSLANAAAILKQLLHV